MIDVKDLEFYSLYEKWYYKKYYNVESKYNVGDLVKIKDNIEINKGYAGQLGIVQGFSGVPNYLYIFAFNKSKNDYWCCGFNEDDLEIPNIWIFNNYEKLFNEFAKWIYQNDIKICTDHFENMLKKYKTGENVFV